MKTNNIIKTLCLAGMTALLPANALASSAASAPQKENTPAIVEGSDNCGTEENTFSFTDDEDDNTTYCIMSDDTDGDEGEFYYSFSDEDFDGLTEDDIFGACLDIEGDIFSFTGDEEKLTFTLSDGDYGDLTEDEINELNSLYSKLDELFETDCNDEEIDKIIERISELEEKAGWVTDDFCFDDETLDELMKEILNDEDYAEYQDISNAFKSIDAILTEDMTDEEIETAYSEHEDEINELIERFVKLFDKAECDFDEII